MRYNYFMRWIILTLGLMIVANAALAQSSLPPENDNRPRLDFLNIPKDTTAPTNNSSLPPANSVPQVGEKILQRTDQVWRWPNGMEEYFMLLAIATGDKQWCDHMSLESQIRKADARPGVQVIAWRNICLIEVAKISKNPDFCRFVRPTFVDALDGGEFDAKYCVNYIDSSQYSASVRANHWLAFNPYKPNFLNAQQILTGMGFTEDDLVSQEKRGLYQTTTKSTWDEYLMNFIDGDSNRFRTRPGNEEKFQFILKRSAYLPDYSKNSIPADRYLRYSGTSVKLPADCYENPTAEFTCRMLECLNVRDILSCRLMSKSQEVQNLYGLFMSKCSEKNPVASGVNPACKQMVDMPYRKIFEGPPDTFLPYLNR